ncbi:uncharacterized protein LOC130713874 [Lotus japonicus]|uniref:uncharacterized protein LOC130713874 n=1 Tax=Lotus japonicus TaxID=34305 RepID=UPI0025889F66|nr:uncharacterized protein LOC130713874 [Lotus japonicus]
MPSNNNNKFSSLSSSLPSNPNPRSSEISNPMRRSFTGNPFSKPSSVIANPRINFPNTPANSPSDFPRRSSVGSIADDKENGKDSILKPAKVRSPAVCSKASKNFMSPTISASIKVNDSPRKKILTERNEPALAPPSSAPASAEPKSQIRKVTFAEPLEEKKVYALFDGFPNFEDDGVYNVPLISKGDSDFHDENVNVNVSVPLIPESHIHTEPIFETVAEDSDCVNLDPTFKLSPMATPPPPPPVSSPATTVAPLDADPLMPPYDPRTNYLSPRPQFLHYRPKPPMDNLEDSFMSGSFSDTEVTEDTQSEVSLKESEDASSDEIVKQEQGEVSEPSPDRILISGKTVEAKEGPKPRFSMRSKAIALVLLLSVAFVAISVTNSPVIDQAMFQDFYGVYESSEFSEFARANFDQFSQFARENYDGLARNLHIWFTKSLTSISELILNVRGANKLVQLQYYNLTALDDFISVHQYPIFAPGENERDAASEIGASEYYVEDISDEHYEVYEEQLQQDMEISTGAENAFDAVESEEALKGQPASMIESEQALQLAEAEILHEMLLAGEVDASFFNVEDASDEEVLKGKSTSMTESEQALQVAEAEILHEMLLAGEVDASFFNVEDASGASDYEGQSTTMVESEQAEAGVEFIVENHPSLNSEAAEIPVEVYGAGNIDTKQGHETDANLGDVDLQQWQDLDSEVAEIQTEPTSIDDAAIEIPQGMVLYMLLCGGTVLIAGAAFNWSRKGKSRSQKVTSCSKEQPMLVKEAHTNKQISPEKPSLRNGPIEMDMLNSEPCPSEMSSFQKSSSYSTRVDKKLNEAHSVEKQPKKSVNRRESLASSSDYSMSPSYGSLTVYEKIPSKGYGDEEIVTPVRRSSRIRSRVTSPL